MSQFLKPQSPLQHKDGDYFYPLTTADQIILDDDSRLNAALNNVVYFNNDNSEYASTVIDADTLGGKLASEYVLKDDLENLDIIPAITPSDNGKFLRIVNGKPSWVAISNAEGVGF